MGLDLGETLIHLVIVPIPDFLGLLGEVSVVLEHEGLWLQRNHLYRILDIEVRLWVHLNSRGVV